MKRHLIIATAAAAALIAGGTVTAVAAGGDSGSGAAQSAAQPTARQAGASGQGSAQVQDGRSSISATDDDADGREDLREAKAAKVTAPDAAAAALKAVPGTVTALDLDSDRSGPVWEADVLSKDGTQHEVTLDAGTARVLKQHTDRGDDDDRGRERAALKDARTTAAEAARTAASRATVTSVELDDDHGTRAVWEVETVTKDGTERTLLVDPQSGKASAAPQDSDDDDNNDGSDD
ncbi:PepSY domain-containing protein [Streptomyces sp. NBC_01456]|uniref:PepSY domain-containing protein n=1 Tax=unclassified Streptomyces TaxID=2593676 RepID=UPI002E314EF1|nr:MULTISPECIES: PepSY domain-containing protein [unclassified Streptomyces]